MAESETESLIARCRARAAEAAAAGRTQQEPEEPTPTARKPLPPLPEYPAPRRRAHEIIEDALYGERRRAEGTRAAQSRYSDDEYRVAFREAAKALAATGDPFTSDEIVDQVGLPPSGSQYVVGALTRSAVQALDLVAVGMRPSTRPERHAARITVWQERYFAVRGGKWVLTS